MSKKDTRRKRRSLEERIADLEAELADVRTRSAKKADPALRHVGAALRALEKARAAAKDAGAQRVVDEVHASLTVLLAKEGGAVPRARRSAGEIDDLADTLLAYLRSNPGLRSEDIAAALGTDSKTIRPVMKRLIAAGKVATEGQRRGMTYTAR